MTLRYPVESILSSRKTALRQYLKTEFDLYGIAYFYSSLDSSMCVFLLALLYGSCNFIASSIQIDAILQQGFSSLD